jgi:hypothetical protein
MPPKIYTRKGDTYLIGEIDELLLENVNYFHHYNNLQQIRPSLKAL